jgi:putative FmdB family regulatory protein
VPTYDYRCRSCGSTYEVIHSMLEEGPTTCERCGGELRRILYPTGIIFKGSGFYRTDSRASSSSSSDGAGKAAAKPAPAATSAGDGSGASGGTSSGGESAASSGKAAPAAGEG